MFGPSKAAREIMFAVLASRDNSVCRVNWPRPDKSRAYLGTDPYVTAGEALLGNESRRRGAQYCKAVDELIRGKYLVRATSAQQVGATDFDWTIGEHYLFSASGLERARRLVQRS